MSEVSSSSSSSSTESGTVWQVINPYLLPDKLKIIVQWMKDGFGYDQDTLRQTFNGRYKLVESEEKGYSLHTTLLSLNTIHFQFVDWFLQIFVLLTFIVNVVCSIIISSCIGIQFPL